MGELNACDADATRGGGVAELSVYDAAAIRRAVGFEDLIEPVAASFADYSRGLGEAPISIFAPAGRDGDVHVKSAWLPGRAVFIVKVASWFAARAARGGTPGSGFVAVLDATTGDLLAVLRDEHHLSDVRTAAAGAVVTRLLARADARTLAVLGTGRQARLQVLAVRAVRPIDAVVIWGRRRSAAMMLRSAIQTDAPELSVSVAGRAEQAVRTADAIVTATAARRPILNGSWLRPGQHVTAVGADDPGKAELDATCFARADRLVVDSRIEAARVAGDLIRAIDAGAVTAHDADELGEIVSGQRPGRRSRSQITVAKLIGLGVQDLAAAETALTRLTHGEPA
jgi:ornithine cyclodeaminase/alanine dehydrogenase-like protein (mu-crystallin family)